MRFQGLLLVAELLMILVSAKADSPAILADPSWSEEMPTPTVPGNSAGPAREIALEVGAPALPAAGLSRLIKQDKVFASAYFDTLHILGTVNGCSDFFGGPAAAAEVFARLAGKMEKQSFPSTIAMRMTGETVHVSDDRTKSRYRLFSRVLVNSSGPFYHHRTSELFVPIAGIGSFRANTKEVRVLMFLHELGHVMKGVDGKWLLPDDGNDDNLSRRNSQKIEGVCGEQIRALYR